MSYKAKPICYLENKNIAIQWENSEVVYNIKSILGLNDIKMLTIFRSAFWTTVN